jgi:hypothetical protein
MFEPRSGHVGFMLDNAELVQVFSMYFGLPCQSFYRLFHIQHYLLPGADIIGQTMTEGTRSLSLTPP